MCWISRQEKSGQQCSISWKSWGLCVSKGSAVQGQTELCAWVNEYRSWQSRQRTENQLKNLTQRQISTHFVLVLKRDWKPLLTNKIVWIHIKIKGIHFMKILLWKTAKLFSRGLNRRSFEDVLKEPQTHIKECRPFWDYIRTVHNLYKNHLMTQILKRACEIVSKCSEYRFSRSRRLWKTIESVLETAPKSENQLKNIKTFKGWRQESDKEEVFHLNLPKFAERSAVKSFQKFPHLKVDVPRPCCKCWNPVTSGAYVHGEPVRGARRYSGLGGRATQFHQAEVLTPLPLYDGKGYQTYCNSLCKSALHKPEPKTRLSGLLRRVQICRRYGYVHRAVHKAAGENQGSNVPKNFLQSLCAAWWCRFQKDCRKVRMSGTHHRRKPRSGCKPDNPVRFRCTDEATDLFPFRPAHRYG